MTSPAITVVVIALVIIVVTCIDTKCPPGTWEREVTFWPVQCVACDIGYYCPGDGFYYVCSNSTIAPKREMAACLPCPSQKPKSSDTRDYCVPADTPQVYGKLHLSLTTLNFSNFNAIPFPFSIYNGYDVVGHFFFESKEELLVLNFIISEENPLVNAYLSTKSGNPSPTNYEVMESGGKLTFVFQRVPDPEMLFFIKFEVASLSKALISSPTTVFTSLVKKQVFSGSTASTLTYSGYYIFFETYVEATSCLNITITIAPDTDKIDTLRMYASTDKRIQYPTESHHQWKSVNQPMTNVKSVSLVLDKVPSGPLYFSATSVIDYATPYTITASLLTNCKKA